MSKFFKFPIRYKIGGRTVSAEATVVKNKPVEPTRSRKAMAAKAVARKVARSTHGNVVRVHLKSPNLASHRRLLSVQKGKYSACAAIP